MSNIEEILTLYCLKDNCLKDQIILLCARNNAIECQNVFNNIRANVVQLRESKRIQELCISRGIDSSIDYYLLRSEIQDLPEDPRPKNTSWYDFLHPNTSNVHSFVKNVLNANNIRVAHEYDEWRDTQPLDIKKNLPSSRNIMDGYFGEKYSNFNELLCIGV